MAPCYLSCPPSRASLVSRRPAITPLVLAVALASVVAQPSPVSGQARPPGVPRPAPGIPPRAPGLELDELDALQQTTLETLRKESGETLRATFREGQPVFVEGLVPVGGDGPAQTARLFLDRYGSALWRIGPNSELRLLRVDASTGLASFTQRYRGLAVEGAQVQVLSAGGVVRAALGRLMPADGTDVVPALDAGDAQRLALERGGTLLAPPRLLIALLAGRGGGARQPRLAWSVSTASGGLAFRRQFDASTGALLREVPLQQDSAASEDEYEAEFFDVNENSPEDGCEGDGDDVEEIGDDDGLFSVGTAYEQRAWFHSRRAYSFYYDRFSRLSYDGSDGPVLGYLESSKTDNAMWSGWCEEISWAPGYGSTDTPVHELSHGVTQFTSGLEYEDESGALNESFSDVMAAIADPENDWLHGEDGFTGGPLRSLRDPKEVDEDFPDHYSDFVDTDDDDGGVHTNSSIPNKAAFLLSEGGVHDGRTVAGIGRTKAGKLLYGAYTGLGSYADFEDLRNTAVSIALYWAALGWHGFSLAEVCSVKNAYKAVGIGNGDADCDGAEDPGDSDDDGDGVADSTDNCRLVPNPGQSDLDHDSEGDACDADDDGDEVLDVDDNCPDKSNPNQLDADHNGIGDICEDPDGDGIPDTHDNCPDDYNPSQADSNDDGFYGDACDPDPDQDGVPASDGDNCPEIANPDQVDADGDLYGDACDLCPNDADPTPAFGFNGQPFQPDSDGDGTPDQCDTSFTIEGRPLLDGLGVSSRPLQGGVSFDGLSRATVPLAICPPPCAEVDSSPLVGLQLDLELAGLAPGTTAMIVDPSGQSWARSSEQRDGSQRLRFAPQGDRQYYLALRAGADAPESSELVVRRFEPSETPPAPADLAVSVQDDPDPIRAEDLVTYTIEASNDGFAAVPGVVIVARLPPRTSVVEAVGCVRGFLTLTCPLGTLAGGESASRSILVRLERGLGGLLQVRAEVRGQAPDPDLTNNVEVERTRVVRRP